jgi:hypothetical protein
MKNTNFKISLIALMAMIIAVFSGGCTVRNDPGYYNDPGYTTTYAPYDYNTYPVYVYSGGRYIRIYHAPSSGVHVYTRSSSGGFSANSGWTGRGKAIQSTTFSNNGGSSWRNNQALGGSSWRSSTGSSTGGSWRSNTSSSPSMGSSWRSSGSSGSSGSSWRSSSYSSSRSSRGR